MSEARAKLPDLIRRVEGGEAVTITRFGQSVAVLVHPDLLRHRAFGATLEETARIREMLAGARSTALAESGALSAERAEELIGAIRAGREAR